MTNISLSLTNFFPSVKKTRGIVSLAVATTVASVIASSAFAFKEGYLPTKDLLEKGWNSERIEESYKGCADEMAFYWEPMSLPGRYTAYFLHE